VEILDEYFKKGGQAAYNSGSDKSFELQERAGQ
jgi:hypothetical protein